MICVKSGNTHWVRQTPVRLKSVDTSKYLATHTMYKYGHPIQGQLEVIRAIWLVVGLGIVARVIQPTVGSG